MLSIKTKVNLSSFSEQFSRGFEEALRPAVQAGAQVIYDEVKKNVDKIEKKSGRLARSVYQVFVKKESIETPNGYSKVAYEVSYNARTAPHAHMVEYGFIMRYQAVQLANGDWITLVRDDAKGKPRPKRRASQAEKDAYYVLRKGGPLQVSAQPFMRPSLSKLPEAAKAISDRFFSELVSKRYG